MLKIDRPFARCGPVDLGPVCAAKDKSCYPCGQMATDALASLIRADASGKATTEIRCDLLPETGRYGRFVGVCYQGSLNLNTSQLKTGNALIDSRYLHQQPTLSEEFIHLARPRALLNHTNVKCRVGKTLITTTATRSKL